MALVWLPGEGRLVTRDLQPLQAWLGRSVVSQLELEEHMQHLGECYHFASSERVNRHIQKAGRMNSQREQKAERNQCRALVCT